MAFVNEVKRFRQDDGSEQVEFNIEADYIKARFEVTEDDQGWEITAVHVTKGCKDEAIEIASEHMNEITKKPIGVN